MNISRLTAQNLRQCRISRQYTSVTYVHQLILHPKPASPRGCSYQQAWILMCLQTHTDFSTGNHR